MINNCPVCASSLVETILEILNVPAMLHGAYYTKEAAMSAPTGDIFLTLCVSCGHLYNAAFETSKVNYSHSEYDNSLLHSIAYREHLEREITFLSESLLSPGASVAEIGAGDGNFLSQLGSKISIQGIGWEPSLENPIRNGEITIHSSHYPTTSTGEKFDLLIMRHVLEHLDDVSAPFTQLKPEQIYLEVPDASFMVSQNSYFDLIYEHVSYFSIYSLSRLLSSVGYAGRFRHTFERRFLCASGVLGDTDQTTVSQEWLQQCREFGHRFDQVIEILTQMFSEMQDLTTCLWGVGTKGIMLANLLPESTAFDILIDSNPKKEGRFIPGRGLRISSLDPTLLKKTDIVMITNNNYAKEIDESLRSFGANAELLYIGDLIKGQLW